MIVAVTLPVSSTADTHSGSVVVPQVDPGLASWVPLNLTPTNHGLVSFSWSASQKANVEWWAAHSCSTSPRTWCVTGQPLKTWTGATSGDWSDSGPVVAIYSVSVNNTANSSLNFSGEFHEELPGSNALLPMLPMAVSIAGGGLLIGMGAIATYLGLFLPSGVYSDPEGELGPAEVDEDGAAFAAEPPDGYYSRPPGNGARPPH